VPAPTSIPNLDFAFSTPNTSVLGLVDQIVIADTGSTDNTIAVAREWGSLHQTCRATVITCLWTDHYADARNISLAPMTTLVLDADEELPDETRHSIPVLLRSSDNVAGYLVAFATTSGNTLMICLIRCHGNTDRHERGPAGGVLRRAQQLPSVPP
jgi:hypothetical protein